MVTDKEQDNLIDEIVIVENTVNENEAGEYTVTYRVTDDCGLVAEKTISVKIIEVKEEDPCDVATAPEIFVEDKVIYVGDKFNPLDGVTAKENGKDITSEIEVTVNNVDTMNPGVYDVTYFVIGECKNNEKTITVTVKEKENNDNKVEVEKEENTTVQKPQTGDDIAIYVIMSVISLVGILVISKKEENN